MIDDTPNPRATLRKLDIACFERIDGKICLCFWEAKDYMNAELWASGDTRPPVAKQVSEYKAIVEKYESDLLASYRVVANNLMSIAQMAGRDDKLCPLIKEVDADGTKLVGATPAHVGVVVFGFTLADRQSERHQSMIKKLEGEGLAVRLQGDAKGLDLRSAVPQSRPRRA
jgi:hypothetical protein